MPEPCPGRFRGPIEAIPTVWLVGLGVALISLGVAPDRAVAVEPCPGGTPAGEVVFQGAFTQSPAPRTVQLLRRSGISQRPIRPATALDGDQELPVSTVSWVGRRTTIHLDGGLRLEGNGRSLSITNLRVVLRPEAPRSIFGRVGTREVRLFSLNRTKVRKRKGRVSEIELIRGVTRLTGAAARLMRNRLGLDGVSKGMAWSAPDLFVRGSGSGDLVGKLPPEAPTIEQPPDAIPIESGTIQWRIRESFVNYLSGGGFVRAIEPAKAGTPEPVGGGLELVYDFEFPQTTGWVDGERALIKAGGGVWFRLCRYTINFTLTAPELSLDGDSSRLIVKAEGTDGTAYDGRRIVLLRLFPSRASKVEVDGRQTVIEGIPAYIAEGATGVFISYPAFPGSFEDPAVELSRFGSISVSYTREVTG